MDAATLRAKISSTVDAARAITAKAEDGGRGLTDSERIEVERHIARAGAMKELLNEENDVAIGKSLARLSGGPRTGRGSLFGEFEAAGWKPGEKTSIPAEVAFKGASFSGDVDDLSPVRYEGASLGSDDSRYLYTVFPAVGVDAGVTSVQVVEQTSRTLPSPLDSSGGGPTVRDIDDTSTKPQVVSVRAMVPASMKQVAAISSGIANILLLSDGFRVMVDADLRLSYERSLDALVVAALAAANPDNVAAGSTLIEQIVRGASQMMDAGYNARVVALSPSDAASLVLLHGADETPYLQGNPLSGFRLVAASGVANGAGYLIDPFAAGKLYLSAPTLGSFEENAGSTNSSTVRFEGTGLLALDRSDAVLQLSATS